MAELKAKKTGASRLPDVDVTTLKKIVSGAVKKASG